MIGNMKEIREDMKDDEELEMLLDEIPHATSLNPHHPYRNGHNVNGGHGHGSFVTQTMNGMMYGMYDDDPSSHNKYSCASPVCGFSLQSDGSSSSLFSGGHSVSDNGSPTPPPLVELKPQLPCKSSHYPNGLWIDSRMPDSPFEKKGIENLTDELNLLRNLNRMYIGDEPEDLSVDMNGTWFSNNSINGINGINSEKFGASGNHRKGVSDCGERQSSVLSGPVSSAFSGLQQEYRLDNLLGSGYSPRRATGLISQSNGSYRPMSSPCSRAKEQAINNLQRGIPVSNFGTSIGRPSAADALFYAQRNGMHINEERGALNSPYMPQLTHQRPHQSMENVLYYCPPMPNGRTRVPTDIRIPQGGLGALTAEESLIIQGEGLNYVISRGLPRSRGNYNKGALHDIGLGKNQERRSQSDGRPQLSGICENGRNARVYCPFSLPAKCNSLAEAKGYIYLMAKDQHGCRFLQRMFDEGSPEDVQIIFGEIINHVVELMMNPFGNYLMQKLLEVCNEEQILQILLMATEERGELVRISLNTHGTRVVQKLIETLKTRQQISLVISALEPGFLTLIKDLNGNHVVQRCLQCLSNEDNKFIFVAAAKYCVDIATHQHGCCVLQRCISHSTGEHREKLVAEISANGLLLSQDAFGNYVVQFILELKIPSATSSLISQFQGNYVHLSTQKFSSHVVEKCLVVFNDVARSRVIHELLSASHFEQLLQDAHANYVVQTALRISEGPLHNLLVDAIECHKAVSRNSPFSKKIFSQKLLKR
ncbi:putative pumilio homolog 7, chloroplastic [Cornus florida]|uniref:putative pumilio homolog 7, chloroplastic n=1 Tax=Cornus florida TaxID=4283 RepID=UPI00289A5696|nr:putative pumilio homolog 7, chloroplastic [Cornus florida]